MTTGSTLSAEMQSAGFNAPAEQRGCRQASRLLLRHLHALYWRRLVRGRDACGAAGRGSVSLNLIPGVMRCSFV
jgi:hypothetical protein